jgi:BMFP domain-containing protein YqiC
MQTTNRLFDDLAKVASGAASTLVGIKQEVDALVQQRLDRLIANLDLVRRDEFEAVQSLAANARAAQERLEVRIAELEARLAESSPAKRAESGPRAHAK